MNSLTKSLARLLPAMLLLPPSALQAQTGPVPQLGKNSVKEVIAAMTLEEKVQLVVGAGRAPKPKPPGPGMSNGWVPQPTMIGHTETKVPGAAAIRGPSRGLLEATPGKPFYAADEYGKRTFLFDVSPEGYLANPKVFAERGQYSVAVDPNGNVYIADGQIYVYDKAGKQLDVIKVPERTTTLVFGGADGKTLYITARTSLYSVQVKRWRLL